jgi:H+-transporting ATPase
VDVLCADKTGTLTQNKLTLGDPFCLDKVTADQLILAGALASRAENGDTIDLAVLGGLKDKGALKPYQVTHFQPFDPVHKRTEATVKAADGGTFKVTKGAPQVIQGLAANTGAVKDAVDKAVNDFAAKGFRALGVARADRDGKWQFLGVLPLFDPPRDDAKSTVATARKMGVTIKMVTGDALAIARETAKVLGMGTNILDGATLGDAKTDETAAVARSIEQADGFAQVFPEHKFHIVDVLQKHGHLVGMTGDGVNDAPALKKADCGIAVSGATDAARAAAAIVLMTPGLSVIIDAIKESRKIFQRMNSYAMYRIAETLRVLLFMTLAIVIFNFYPLTAVMIVMLALLNDGAILSIAYDNVHYKDAPEAWNMRLVLGIATVLGIVGPIAAFGLFYLGDRVFGLDRPHLQTMMYLMLSVAGHLTIFQTRTRGPFWSIRPAPILLIAVFGTQVIATLIAVYGAGLVTPLGWHWAFLVWFYAVAWFLLTDPVKLLAYRVLDPVKRGAVSALPLRRPATASPGGALRRTGHRLLGPVAEPIMLSAAGLGVLALLVGGGYWTLDREGGGRAVLGRLQSDLALLEPAAQPGAQGERALAGAVSEPAKAPEKSVAPLVVHPPEPPPAARSAVATVVPASPGPAPASSAAGAPGKATVQLATVRSEAAATYEWHRLQKRLPDLLASREPFVTRTEHGGRAFWLLHTGGFADHSQADALCQRLHAKGFHCEVTAAE